MKTLRLEHVRAHAEQANAHAAEDDPSERQTFGFLALDAVLGEVNGKLHERTSAIVLSTRRTTREARYGRDREGAQEQLRKASVRLQSVGACAEALEAMLKDALEQQAAAISDALGSFREHSAAVAGARLQPMATEMHSGLASVRCLFGPRRKHGSF